MLILPSSCINCLHNSSPSISFLLSFNFNYPHDPPPAFSALNSLPYLQFSLIYILHRFCPFPETFVLLSPSPPKYYQNNYKRKPISRNCVSSLYICNLHVVHTVQKLCLVLHCLKSFFFKKKIEFPFVPGQLAVYFE